MMHDHKHFGTSLVAVAATMLMAGCAEDVRPPQTAAVSRPAPLRPSVVEQRTPAANVDRDTLSSIHVDDEIARVCDLPTAHFAFDSAAINGSAADALDALAACFTDGALAGRSLKVVGHADPRGPLEYNFALGQRRAGSVSDYLAGRGLDPARMTTSSLGELEATGTDEFGWSQDRKVEILLAEKALVPTDEESPYSQLELQEQ